MLLLLLGFMIIFQSTLPYGSDYCTLYPKKDHRNFNPRSLTGATQSNLHGRFHQYHFNPRSLTGATYIEFFCFHANHISIHAPLRERRFGHLAREDKRVFQSTLPYGSDASLILGCLQGFYFNPRSLTGATALFLRLLL